MNIKELKGCVHTKQLTPVNKAAGGQGFDRILNGAMDRIAHKMSAQEGLPSVKPMEAQGLCDRVCEQHRVLKQADSLLGLLDEYSLALNNPRMTLKAIDQIVNRIEQETKALNTQLRENVTKNDELAGIARQIAVTASAEVCKFNRGDYV